MNGYTTLTVNGKKIGLKFGLEALYMIEEKMSKMNKVPRVGDFYNVMLGSYYAYAGYYVNCLIKDDEIELTYEYFHDYFEENIREKEFLDEVTHMMEVFNASIKVIVDKNTPVEDKDEKKNHKKLTGKKSKETVINSD